MPIDYTQYADNYRERAWQRKEATGWRCEECGAKHGSIKLNWLGEPYEVVLTAAHLDHDPWNPEARLASYCQACHLNYDRPEHVEHAKATWQRKFREAELAAGQLILFADALNFTQNLTVEEAE